MLEGFQPAAFLRQGGVIMPVQVSSCASVSNFLPASSCFPLSIFEEPLGAFENRRYLLLRELTAVAGRHLAKDESTNLEAAQHFDVEAENFE